MHKDCNTEERRFLQKGITYCLAKRVLVLKPPRMQCKKGARNGVSMN